MSRTDDRVPREEYEKLVRELEVVHYLIRVILSFNICSLNYIPENLQKLAKISVKICTLNASLSILHVWKIC